MENEVIEVLERYFDQLNDIHKSNAKQLRKLKKEVGLHEAYKQYNPSCNMRTLKEKKLHIKRLIKLIKEK